MNAELNTVKLVISHWTINSHTAHNLHISEGNYSAILTNTARDLYRVKHYSLSWLNYHMSWSKCCLSVCPDVNQGGTNRNHCTQRLVILRALAY